MFAEQSWLGKKTFLPFRRYGDRLDSLLGAESRQQGQISMGFPSL